MTGTPTTPLVPSVAVITRTKDRTVLLRRAIESVIRQTFGDWVHVIVNDGGNSHELDLLVNEYASRYRGRAKVIHLAENVGIRFELVPSSIFVTDVDIDSSSPLIEHGIEFTDCTGFSKTVRRGHIVFTGTNNGHGVFVDNSDNVTIEGDSTSAFDAIGIHRLSKSRKHDRPEWFGHARPEFWRVDNAYGDPHGRTCRRSRN